MKDQPLKVIEILKVICPVCNGESFVDYEDMNCCHCTADLNSYTMKKLQGHYQEVHVLMDALTGQVSVKVPA
ncbi:hypothetical protein P6N53_18110 [Desulforamulus aquiferis]|uniref:Uncharacterized protein n=1 Tax=Desulforamulus aquiferis TaxID=1397668 RepID=A0AAW7ZHF9_9FIRM|nr:hypothetical protein [Desulforamulus aquiferis]